MIVAYESCGRGPMLVASSATGSAVSAICDGSVDCVLTAGVQSEQNMLRPLNWPPSLLRAAATGAWVCATTGVIFGACSGSGRYLASTMWLVALAANTAQVTTVTAPSTQKWRLIRSCI